MANSGQNSGNSSITGGPHGTVQLTVGTLQQRSKSTSASQKQLKSHKKYDLSSIYIAAQQENLLPKNTSERVSRYL